ncbi:MAG: hypothetical protein IJU01_01625 [Lachnospiraceae bacterium]|nr:hypothetical protein [Lachnospiraceae bacterium]
MKKTIDGKMVRSKSEAIIYEQLKNYGIPFRYECDLSVNGHVICLAAKMTISGKIGR